MLEEVWKDIPGLEGRYQASTIGRVRSLTYSEEILNRWGTITLRTPQGRILAPWLSKTGYSYHQLGAKNKKETHYWVAITFLGPRLPKYEVNHINFNRSDNRVENLEWTSRSENRRHSLENLRGNTVVFTAKQVLEIRDSKIGSTKLSKQFGVDRHTISNIRSKRTWKWL